MIKQWVLRRVHWVHHSWTRQRGLWFGCVQLYSCLCPRFMQRLDYTKGSGCGDLEGIYLRPPFLPFCCFPLAYSVGVCAPRSVSDKHGLSKAMFLSCNGWICCWHDLLSDLALTLAVFVDHLTIDIGKCPLFRFCSSQQLFYIRIPTVYSHLHLSASVYLNPVHPIILPSLLFKHIQTIWQWKRPVESGWFIRVPTKRETFSPGWYGW